MASDHKNAVKKIDSIFKKYAAAKSAASKTSILPSKVTDGKVYEAWVLALVLEKLETEEGYKVSLDGGPELRLKAAPGPINPDYAHFVLEHPVTGTLMNVWTDIEFLTLSYAEAGPFAPPPVDGDYHELDVVVVDEDVTGRPANDQVLLGVECKNSAFGKDLLRAALGVRRELSLYTGKGFPTHFKKWPRNKVQAKPASCFLVYSTAWSVNKYQKNGEIFGIDFICEPLI